MSTSFFTGKPWAKSILLPLWFIQTLFTLALVGFYLTLIITTVRQRPRPRDGYIVLVTTHFLTQAVVVAQLCLLLMKRLTPLMMLLSQTVMSCYWTAILLVSILCRVRVIDTSFGSDFDLGFGGCAAAAVWASLIYAVVIFRREGSGVFLPAEDGSRAQYSTEDYQRVEAHAEE